LYIVRLAMSTHYFCTTPATIDDPTLVRMEDIVGPTICRRRCLHRNNSPMTVQAMPLALQIIKPAVPSSRRKHLGSNTAAARHTTSSYPQTRVSSIGLAEHALSGVIGLTYGSGLDGSTTATNISHGPRLQTPSKRRQLVLCFPSTCSLDFAVLRQE
jgi:hypothetical protein